jgi:hypothetical protein
VQNEDQTPTAEVAVMTPEMTMADLTGMIFLEMLYLIGTLHFHAVGWTRAPSYLLIPGTLDGAMMTDLGETTALVALLVGMSVRPLEKHLAGLIHLLVIDLAIS